MTLEWKDAAGAVTRSGKGMGYVNREGEMRLETTEPDKRTILLTGDTVYVYEPARAIVEEFRLSQHPERLEPFALLGFSATGERLQREYLVTPARRRGAGQPTAAGPRAHAERRPSANRRGAHEHLGRSGFVAAGSPSDRAHRERRDIEHQLLADGAERCIGRRLVRGELAERRGEHSPLTRGSDRLRDTRRKRSRDDHYLRRLRGRE